MKKRQKSGRLCIGVSRALKGYTQPSEFHPYKFHPARYDEISIQESGRGREMPPGRVLQFDASLAENAIFDEEIREKG